MGGITTIITAMVDIGVAAVVIQPVVVQQQVVQRQPVWSNGGMSIRCGQTARPSRPSQVSEGGKELGELAVGGLALEVDDLEHLTRAGLVEDGSRSLYVDVVD